MKNKLDVIKARYIENIDNYSIEEYKILGWASRFSQEARFNVMLEVLLKMKNIETKTVVDIGCGLGHFARVLEGANIKTNYVGLDLIEEMITRASNFPYHVVHTNFIKTDIFKSKTKLDNVHFDYVFISGVFNLNLGNNKAFLKNALTLLINITKEVLCFNMLDSDYKMPKGRNYFYYRKNEILKLTKDLLNKYRREYKKIELKDDYLPNDFSIIVYFI